MWHLADTEGTRLVPENRFLHNGHTHRCWEGLCCLHYYYNPVLLGCGPLRLSYTTTTHIATTNAYIFRDLDDIEIKLLLSLEGLI